MAKMTELGCVSVVTQEEGRWDVHDADAEDAEEGDLVRLLDVQLPDHGEWQEAHDAIDDDVDDADRRVACNLVPACALGSRVPVLLDGAADEEADEDGHDEPGRLDDDDGPREVLSTVSGLRDGVLEGGGRTMNFSTAKMRFSIHRMLHLLVHMERP
jgi:hypothetical protein